MFLPIGLDEMRFARRSWISIGIAAACIAVHLVIAFAGDRGEVERRIEAVDRYWRAHPYLEPPETLANRFRVERPERGARPPRWFSRERVASEQTELDGLADDLLQAIDDTPERRFSLVPAHGLAQPGWLTHMFLHAGWLHLAGNLFVFLLLVGPFLEDVWGRPFYLAFYLAGGLVAGIAQVLLDPRSQIHLLGASGAISACLGAFTLRFAHRRVKIFYWFGLVFRGTFLVPAWAYALFGAAMDVWGLKASGGGGGVAYAAHVGGFLFGLAAAAAVGASGLDRKLAPEGAVAWRGSIGGARAAEAAAAGRTAQARELYRGVLRSDPADDDALLGLARLELASGDAAALHEAADRLLARRIGAGDEAGARAALGELGGAVDPAQLRPATAYRAGELLEGVDRARAARFHEAAGAAGGAVGAKALLRAAELWRTPDPSRAVALADRAAALEGAPHELSERARRLAARLRPPAAAVEPPPASGGVAPPRTSRLDGAPVRLVPCRVTGAGPAGLELVTSDGRRASLAPDRVESIAVGLVDRFELLGSARPNAVLADVVLRARPGDGKRTVLRLPAHLIALGAIHPGVAPAEAFARLIDGLLAASGAAALPGHGAARGRPFARFPDAAAFEETCHGRRLAT